MRWFIAVMVLGLASCVDATPVGFVECIGEHTRCELRNAVSYALTDFKLYLASSRELETLEPTWSQRLEISPDAENIPPYAAVAHGLGSNGELWQFLAGKRDVQVAVLDDSGERIAETILEPKADRPKERTIAEIRVSNANSGPILHVTWADDQGADAESVLFTRDAEGAQPIVAHRGKSPYAHSHGSWRAGGGNHPYIERYDEQSNLVWRQTGTLTDRESWTIHAESDREGRLHALVMSEYDTSPDPEVWRLDRDGNVDRRFSLASHLVPWSHFLVDGQSRGVAISSDESGDLFMLRPETRDGLRVEREEYQSLHPRLAGIDVEGNIYVLTRAGGREHSQQRPLLCRLMNEGWGRCVQLKGAEDDELLSEFELLAANPGVVYLRTYMFGRLDDGSERNRSDLFRFDWPED